MAIAVAHAERSFGSRWTIAFSWLTGLFIYSVLIWLTDADTARWVNDGAWTIASACAALVCMFTARQLRGRNSRAWWLLGGGCASWFLGQLCWNYSDLVLGTTMSYVSVGQALYAVLPLSIIAATTQLPERQQSAPVMLKQLGNVGLVLCCLVTIVVLALIEPAMQADMPAAFIWIGAYQNVVIGSTFLYALYVLWTYRWTETWSSVLLIVIATGIYSVSNLIYVHALLTHTYLSRDVINISWLVVFGLIAFSASERLWVFRHQHIAASDRVLLRERWLEAVIPALLIIIMVVVALASSATLTPRVLGWAAIMFVIFAIILGVREALIQSDAQRLNDDLTFANRRLNETIDELRDSELRYRDLNIALEKRVAERTAQLERAYGELEGFSYAVAHDLKAPLRAINGFAHLLREELGASLNEQSDAHLMRIRNGAMKMSALIDDLLSYAHIERRDMHASHVNLSTLVTSVLAEFEGEIQPCGVQVEVDVAPVTVFVDSDGLALVLRNLLENALKYSCEMDQAIITIRVENKSHSVVLSVGDNGIGFDMQYHDRIFKVFERLHRDDRYPGTGIGLALVRKAVERMGGRVWAESKPGEGAVFFVELPRIVNS
jgi:signal transduction histidine kinase